ncbi:MAG: hypothetical protein DVB22_001801 [Verrucomicrobia bacterium]|nr:MAG: hypothetical protein DVB22_001801 [Verrucomicrobiota bacterium]
MNAPLPPSPWDHLAAARRRVDATSPISLDEPLPPGFATRTVARWAALRREDPVRFWSIWSLRAALTSLAAVALFLLFSPSESADSQPLLNAPSLGIPSL